MSSAHSGFRVRVKRNVVSWTGSIQPSGASQTYLVRIDYQLPRRPKAWVLEPKLRRRNGSPKIPHTFSDGSICLHCPREWTAQMLIADKIIPWLSLWLLHYEYWRAGGEWLGGGHEPGTK